MAENISVHLTAIEKNSKKLNAAADTLTEAVRALNERLASMNVGVSVYYTDEFFEFHTDQVTGDLETCRYYAGYDRDQDGVWGVTVLCRRHRVDLESLPKDATGKSADIGSKVNKIRWIRGFDKCPRNVRLALCRYIPKVIEGLAQAVGNVADTLEESLREIESIQP
jgi:hypothetical protein